MCLLLCNAQDEAAFVAASLDADTRGEAKVAVLLVAGELSEAEPVPRPRRHTRLFAWRADDDMAGKLAKDAENFAAALVLSGANGAENDQALRTLWPGGRSRGAEGVLQTVYFGTEDLDGPHGEDSPLPFRAADPRIGFHAGNTVALLELARGRLSGPKLPCLLDADAAVLAHLVLPPQDLFRPVAVLREGLQAAIQDAPRASYCRSSECEYEEISLDLVPADGMDEADEAVEVSGLPAPNTPTRQVVTVTEFVPAFLDGGPIPAWPVATTCEVDAAMTDNCRVTWALVVQEPDTLSHGEQHQARLGGAEERGNGRDG